MSTQFQKLDSSTPQNGRADDVSSVNSGMTAGNTNGIATSSAANPDRRLRNRILLINAAVWIAIIVLVRWLLF
jgi:hypothetical protein